MGIEPTYPAWKAGVLPLNYTRIFNCSQVGVTGFEPATSWSQTRRSSQAEPHPVICLYAFLFFCLTRDIFYNFYFCLSSTFFTFFNIFCCHFIFPLCFRLIAFNVLYHTIVFLFCQHLFSKVLYFLVFSVILFPAMSVALTVIVWLFVFIITSFSPFIS